MPIYLVENNGCHNLECIYSFLPSFIYVCIHSSFFVMPTSRMITLYIIFQKNYKIIKKKKNKYYVLNEWSAEVWRA